MKPYIPQLSSTDNITSLLQVKLTNNLILHAHASEESLRSPPSKTVGLQKCCSQAYNIRFCKKKDCC